MNRAKLSVLFVAIFSVLLFVAQFFWCKFKQPEPLPFASGKGSTTSYVEEGKIYALTGNYHYFPGQLVGPALAPSRIDYTHIDSLDDVKSTTNLNSNNYVATLCFGLNLQSHTKYTLWIPPAFTEYRVYVNGILNSQSPTWGSTRPAYPSSNCITLPANDDGYYNVVIHAVTNKRYVNNSSSTILLGVSDGLLNVHKMAENVSIILCAFIIITIIFTLIQVIAFAVDLRLISFSLLSLATLILMAIGDERIINLLFRRMPFQVGLFLEAFMPPLFLLALLFYSYSMYPKFLSHKFGVTFTVLLLLPIANGITLFKYPALNVLAQAITIIPYGMFIYSFVLATMKRQRQTFSYGIGIASLFASVLLANTTRNLAVPSRYTYMLGYIVFGFTMVALIAADYVNQEISENALSSELALKLEDMQTSENAFLNAQMKPHFLYNTLNTIADCCVTDSKKAQSLINSLSEYLKLILNLDNMDKTVPLQRELELVTAYTAIEKERFPSINFYNDFPVTLPIVMMPPITLQPLIENAIKHGVRKSDKPGVVTLRIMEDEDYVEFYVSDNGTGMDEETIKNLFKMPKENKSIGIYNIDKRLKNIYHEGLHVESTPGLGTCVSFRVAKIRR